MNRLSWNIGRIEGIDLYVHPTFLILIAWTFLFQGGSFAVLLTIALFGCVLLHELGHALAARMYGIRTEDITLYPIGGVARLERMPRSAGPELVIAIAGPIVNFVIAAGLYVGLTLVGPRASAGFFGLFLTQLMIYNLGLGLFNLVPAFPMDGGRILRAVLSSWVGRLRATEFAASLGQFLALVAGGQGLLQGQFLFVILALFIYFAGRSELLGVRFEEMRRRGPAETFLSPPPPGFRWVSRGDGIWVLDRLDYRGGFHGRI
jgi:Zn-dependent protease